MKNIKRIAIIENELENTNDLEISVKKFFENKKINFKIDKYNTAKSFLNNYEYFDLVFIDVNLPDINGIKAIQELRKIDQKVLVIFVTSAVEYAIKGYSVNAFDFIAKPFDYDDFASKLERALPRLKQSKKLVIIHKQSMRILNISQIVYIEVDEHKIIFHLNNGENIDTYGTMKSYLETLKNHNFALCNQCYLVNLKYVDGIQNDYVIINNEQLLISRPKKKEFINAITNFINK